MKRSTPPSPFMLTLQGFESKERQPANTGGTYTTISLHDVLQALNYWESPLNDTQFSCSSYNKPF
eukprot:1018798-Pelagomonas_calceolata.AAC.1